MTAPTALSTQLKSACPLPYSGAPGLPLFNQGNQLPHTEAGFLMKCSIFYVDISWLETGRSLQGSRPLSIYGTSTVCPITWNNSPNL